MKEQEQKQSHINYVSVCGHKKTTPPFIPYGKRNIMIREYRTIKNRLSISNYTKQFISSLGMKAYTPKLNKIRVCGGVLMNVFALPLLPIPLTNTFILGLSVRWALK